MAKLIFRNADLKKIKAYNDNSRLFKRSWIGAFTEYQKSVGREVDFSEDIPDEFKTTTTPFYFFVKDSGIYLMTGADMEKLPTDKSHVAYAVGYDPDKNGNVWERCRAAVGGDDFGEEIDAQYIDEIIESGKDLVLTVTPTQIFASAK